MGKIRQLREDQLINGGSQEHIYPITHAKAVYEKSGKNIQAVIEEIQDGDWLKDGSIKTRHLQDKSVTTEKINNEAVTTDKIKDGNITTNKINNQAVTTDKIADGSVTTDKIDTKAITTDKVADGNITNEKLSKDSVTSNKIKNDSVTTDKILDKNVTNEKLADNTITIDKLDEDLRNTLQAATGLPEDILEQFQDISEKIEELQDSEFPIELSMNISFSSPTHTISYSVRNKGEAFVGDRLSLAKTYNDSHVRTLATIPTSSGVAQSNVEGNKEVFKLEVGAEGHTTKSISATRYICYAGGSNSSTISSQIIDTFRMYSSPNVSFNPTVTTTNSQYMWIVVPSYLTVRRVTSSGFDVTLQPAQNITTPLGTFKAYRTVNTLTAQTWNLVIS